MHVEEQDRIPGRTVSTAPPLAETQAKPPSSRAAQISSDPDMTELKMTQPKHSTVSPGPALHVVANATAGDDKATRRNTRQTEFAVFGDNMDARNAILWREELSERGLKSCSLESSFRTSGNSARAIGVGA